MSAQDNGGPAFPAHPSAMGDHDGMTLRDYFAAKAMQGLCAGLEAGDNVDALPALCYEMADAMLKARSE